MVVVVGGENLGHTSTYVGEMKLSSSLSGCELAREITLVFELMILWLVELFDCGGGQEEVRGGGVVSE